jgi:hypothetical protein
MFAQPTPEVTKWLHEVLSQIEATAEWDDGALLRAVIIGEYGLAGLQQIEAYQSPQPCTFEGGAAAWWNSRDPWATAKEAKRRKDEIRALYRGDNEETNKMVNVWMLEELNEKYTKAQEQFLKEKAALNKLDPMNVKHAVRIAYHAKFMDYWAKPMAKAARYIAEFDSVVELQRIADYLHTIMPDVWSGKKIDYHEDKNFWQCDGRLMGRDTAKSALQTMKEYCKSKDIELPAV